MKRRSTTPASRGRTHWEEPKDRRSDVGVQWEEPKGRLCDVGVQWEEPKDHLSDVGVQWEEPMDHLSDVGVQWEEPKDHLSDVGVQWEEPKDHLSDVGVQWEEPKDHLSGPRWCEAAVQVDVLGLSCSAAALQPSPITTPAVASCGASPSQVPDSCMAPLSSDESDSQIKDNSTSLLGEKTPQSSLSSLHSDTETPKLRRKTERAAGLPLRYLLDYALERTGGDPARWDMRSVGQSTDSTISNALTEGIVTTEAMDLNRSQKVGIKKELRGARVSEHGKGKGRPVGRPKTNTRKSIDIKHEEVVLEGDLAQPLGRLKCAAVGPESQSVQESEQQNSGRTQTIPLGDVRDVECGLVKKMQILSGKVATRLKPPSLDSAAQIKLEFEEVLPLSPIPGGRLPTELTQGSTGIKLDLNHKDTPKLLVFRDDQSNALTLILPCVVKLLRQPV